MTTKKAALLDVDGTLLDSNDAHAQSWVDTFAAHGFDVDPQLVRDLIGKGGDKLLDETVHVAKDSPEGKELTKHRAAIFKKTYLPQLRAFPGARALLERMKEAGLKLVVATSAGSDEVNDLLKQAGVDDLIQATTTSSDAKESKPDPDIVVAALARAGCAPREAVMLGDTPYDVSAARKAGVAVVALRCGGWEDADLSDANAIYDGAADLLRAFDTSPFGR